MRKIHMLACSSALVTAFMADDTHEVVLVSGGKDGPVRVNKADFDADQEKPSAERQYSKYSGKDEAIQTGQGNMVRVGPGTDIKPVAAPSAPDFSGSARAPAPVDPVKNAVAPATRDASKLLVVKEGKAYFVVDGKGEKVDYDGINKDGYTKEEHAWDAVRTYNAGS